MIIENNYDNDNNIDKYWQWFLRIDNMIMIIDNDIDNTDNDNDN